MKSPFKMHVTLVQIGCYHGTIGICTLVTKTLSSKNDRHSRTLIISRYYFIAFCSKLNLLSAEHRTIRISQTEKNRKIREFFCYRGTRQHPRLESSFIFLFLTFHNDLDLFDLYIYYDSIEL
uniref:Uncharacterized protein n=1 Tax=Cacopsylla melanoneura TaxID=428564 RepID=A0A8D8R8A6_9HEMI